MAHHLKIDSGTSTVQNVEPGTTPQSNTKDLQSTSLYSLSRWRLASCCVACHSYFILVAQLQGPNSHLSNVSQACSETASFSLTFRSIHFFLRTNSPCSRKLSLESVVFLHVFFLICHLQLEQVQAVARCEDPGFGCI